MDKTDDANWWAKQDHASAWDRVKEALRRDWEQTKHDFSISGGHQLNQDIGDTVKQATGKEHIPSNDKPVPPKVIGSWDDVEFPVSYGYGAKQQFGERHPGWSDKLEGELERDWKATKHGADHAWNDVKGWVRHGYEYKGQH